MPQSTSCPVCTAEGVDTALGPDPLRDQLRVDFMITDLLRKVLGQLDSGLMLLSEPRCH
jgi:hypothetical protein